MLSLVDWLVGLFLVNSVKFVDVRTYCTGRVSTAPSPDCPQYPHTHNATNTPYSHTSTSLTRTSTSSTDLYYCDSSPIAFHAHLLLSVSSLLEVPLRIPLLIMSFKTFPYL